MAFLVIGAVHQAIRGVQSGIQAHKDFKTPVQVVDPHAPTTTAPLDRYGHAKEHHPVYGWVMKAEHKFNKDKGKGKANSEQGAGPSGSREVEGRGLNKEELESQRYSPPHGPPPPAPPSYEVAVAVSSHSSAFGAAQSSKEKLPGDGYDFDRSATDGHSDRVDQSKEGPVRGFEAQHQDASTSSSSSSSDDDSELGEDQASSSILSSRQIRKKERRVRKAERRLSRVTARAERNANRRGEGDLDSKRVERARERLGSAQKQLENARK